MLFRPKWPKMIPKTMQRVEPKAGNHIALKWKKKNARGVSSGGKICNCNIIQQAQLRAKHYLERLSLA